MKQIVMHGIYQDPEDRAKYELLACWESEGKKELIISKIVCGRYVEGPRLFTQEEFSHLFLFQPTAVSESNVRRKVTSSNKKPLISKSFVNRT